MPSVARDPNQVPRFWTIAFEAVSEGRAAIAGAGVAIGILGFLYMFSYVSNLHFVRYLDEVRLDVFSGGAIGAAVGAMLRAYFAYIKKKF